MPKIARTDRTDSVEGQRPDIPDSVLEVQDVSKSYFSASNDELNILDAINLTVRPNEFISIVGASGCGKTTLMKIMAGLLKATQGQVMIDGSPVNGPRPTKTAVVFQEDALLPWFKVKENVALGLAAQGVRKSEQRERVSSSLSTVGLKDHADVYPHQMSGGMRQRAALARGLVLEPRLLLLDEPFAALDEQTRNLMGAELRAMHHRVSGAMIMITHSLTEAVLLSDRVVAMSANPGRIRRIVDVPLEEEREASMVDRADFVDLRHLLWSELQEDWLKSMSRN